ncbi:hypothetical protein MRB53_037514 [Persea americana]|nr:hypothetical protein MRB53_037514 [Persea americana]
MRTKDEGWMAKDGRRTAMDVQLSTDCHGSNLGEGWILRRRMTLAAKDRLERQRRMARNEGHAAQLGIEYPGRMARSSGI